LNIFIRSGDIRHQSLKLIEIGPNFACFWFQNFLGGGPLEVLDQDYKIKHTSEHRAKFCGNRSTELEDLTMKKMPAKRKPASQAIVSGQTNKSIQYMEWHSTSKQTLNICGFRNSAE